VQNERSGARRQRKPSTGEEVLSPAEAAALGRGQTLKRYVRAAAALSGLYDDTAIGDALKVNRGAVAGWWTGARPQPDTLRRLARLTGLSFDELTEYVYFEGPPPALPATDPATLPVLEGARRGRLRRAGQAPDTPAPRPAPRPRGSRAAR